MAREAFARLCETEDATERLVWERLAFARREGNRRRQAETLAMMARDFLDRRRFDDAARLAEEAARGYESFGDDGRVAQLGVLVELIRQTERDDGRTTRIRFEGMWEIDRRAGAQHPSRSLRWMPPREGAPIHDFASSGCALALDVLSRPVGERTVNSYHVALPDGGWEHVGVTSWVAAESDCVRVVAGTFTDCRRVEVTIRVGADTVDADRAALRGYMGATIQAWFARGVGCVRVIHRHDNGKTTDLQLTSFHIVEPSRAPFPLTVGNRWVYAWTDEITGTEFEDTLFVATHRDSQSRIGFVTSVTARGTDDRGPGPAKLLFHMQRR